MHDGTRAREFLSAAQYSALAPQSGEVQKHVSTIPRSLPEYRPKLSLDVWSWFHAFCRSLLDVTCDNEKSPQRGTTCSVTDVLAAFEQKFQTLEP